MLFSRRLFGQWMQLWHFKLVWMIAHERFEENLRLQVPGKVFRKSGPSIWGKVRTQHTESGICEFMSKITDRFYISLVIYYIEQKVSICLQLTERKQERLNTSTFQQKCMNSRSNTSLKYTCSSLSGQRHMEQSLGYWYSRVARSCRTS